MNFTINLLFYFILLKTWQSTEDIQERVNQAPVSQRAGRKHRKTLTRHILFTLRL